MKCDRYKKNNAVYRVTFEDKEADFWGDKHTRHIEVTGDALDPTIRNISFFGLHFIRAEKISN